MLGPVCRRLGPQATLHPIEGGDHSCHVLKRSERTDAEAMGEADAVAAFASELFGREHSTPIPAHAP